MTRTVTEPPVQTRHGQWSPVLRDLRADLLDCVQANLAAVAELAHGAGSSLALGAHVRFPQLSTVDDRLAQAAELLGLRVTARADGLTGSAVRELAADGLPRYVVADAFTMPWVPYNGHQHLEHSFLVVAAGSSVTIVDAYHNDTQWGQARPGVWRLPAAVFDAAVDDATVLSLDAGPLPALDVPALLAANGTAMADARQEIDRYLAGVGADTIDAVVLDIWLLGRSRALHAAWLDRLGLPAEAATAHAQAWLTLASQSYVAMRRILRGGPFPVALSEDLTRVLREDVALAAGGTPAEVEHEDTPAEVTAVVHESLRVVLGLADDDVLAEDRALRDLPGFNSFKLIDVIERVETALGVELDPDQLTASSLRDVGSLCALFGPAYAEVTER